MSKTGKIISGGDTVQKVGISTKLSASIARSPDVQEKILANADYIAQMEIDEFFIEHDDIVEAEDNAAAEAQSSEMVFNDLDMLNIAGLLQGDDEALSAVTAPEQQQTERDDEADTSNVDVSASAAAKKIVAAEVVVEAVAGLEVGAEIQEGSALDLVTLTACEIIDSTSISSIEAAGEGDGSLYNFANGYWAAEILGGEGVIGFLLYDPQNIVVGECDHVSAEIYAGAGGGG